MKRLDAFWFTLGEFLGGPMRIEIGVQQKDAGNDELVGLPDVVPLLKVDDICDGPLLIQFSIFTPRAVLLMVGRETPSGLKLAPRLLL